MIIMAGQNSDRHSRRGGSGVDVGRGPLWSPAPGNTPLPIVQIHHGRPQGSPPHVHTAPTMTTNALPDDFGVIVGAGANGMGGGDHRGRPGVVRGRSRPLYAILPLLLLSLLLAACGDAINPTSTLGPIDSTTTANSHLATTPAVLAIGKYREYPLPQTDSGMMRPAIDQQGRIWFGEMGHNYLAVFDPRTQKFQQITPPRGLSGIMGIEVASDDTIWFAEQYADYIGHYFPATGRFQTYPLPTITAPDPSDASKTLTLPSAPNDLALDNHGNVWFTEINADALGRLTIASGTVQQYPLSATKSALALNPYGVTIDPQGMVWFTESSSNHIGRLDPATGQIRYFTQPNTNTALMEITSGTGGTIWITTFNSVLLSLNPATGAFKSFVAPAANGSVGASGGIYGVLSDASGNVWVTLAAQNVIAHLDVASNRFTYYTIPTSGSLPLGIVEGAHNTFWFTEAGSNKVGMLQP